MLSNLFQNFIITREGNTQRRQHPLAATRYLLVFLIDNFLFFSNDILLQVITFYTIKLSIMIDCYTNFFIQGCVCVCEREREREREGGRKKERERTLSIVTVSTIVVLLTQLILIVMVTNIIICKWHPKVESYDSYMCDPSFIWVCKYHNDEIC